VDADFTLSERRVIEFCRAIIEKGLNDKIKFVIQTHSFSLIKKDVLRLMKKSGFNTISFGIERLNGEIQKKIGKPLKKEIIVSNISGASKVGFITQVNYLIGFNFENEKLIEQENKYFMELFDKGVDVISVSILSPMPGTEEYESQRSKLEGWYLNPVLLETFRPLYLIVKNLIYDPFLVNVYSFNHRLIRKLILTKILFRSESIKKKSYFLYLIYQLLLFASFFSEKFYRSNMKFVEQAIFGKFHALVWQTKVNLALYWAKGEKTFRG